MSASRYSQLTQYIAGPLKSLSASTDRLGRAFRSVKHIIIRLSFAQKLYLIALILALTINDMAVVAVIAVVAMTVEFWPIFERVWHSLAGKAVLLLFYAIIANFALGWSGAIVNEVVGVPANHLDYTHNLAILLYMPVWFVVVSALFLLALQLIIPLYLCVIFLLKPLGVKSLRLTSHTAFRKTTFVTRIILASVVLGHMVVLIDVESTFNNALKGVIDTVEQLDDRKVAGANTKEPEQSALSSKVLEVVNAAEDKMIDVVAEPQAPVTQSIKGAEPERSADLNKALRLTIDTETEDDMQHSYAQVRVFYQRLVRVLIANFAYSMEANSRSRCQKNPESNVIELNDYEILQITPDKQAEYGYRFEVKKCLSAAFPLAQK